MFLNNPRKEVFSNKKKPVPPFPSDKFDNLFWFVHISDIHISIYVDPQRIVDFQEFCQNTLKVIKPDVVLVTGDLTDAKSKNRFSSKQLEYEWMNYSNILENTQVTKDYTWIDIRGNHDAFDVMSQNDSKNFYLKYSGDKAKLSCCSWTLKKPFGNYSFIPVDGTLMPGPKRPFNFVGHLSQKKLDFLYNEGKKSVGSNLTFWYGHYPSSVMTYGSQLDLRTIIGKFGDVYLNGHFHSFHGIAPELYAMQSTGFLELELKDWMENRYYRIVAVDHDLLSFVDVAYRDWPIVLITNPKPATFIITGHEPTSRILNSTHVRFLVFSPFPIQQITVFIDNMMIDDAPRHVKGPLWVSRWNPEMYSEGMHKLIVEVQDKAGKVKSSVSEFSLNHHWSTQFTWTSSILLLTDLCTFFQGLFITTSFTSLAMLIYIKRYGAERTDGFFFKLYLLLLDDSTFVIIFIFYLNILIGPIFVGELLTDRVGVCFSYGLLIDKNFIYEYTPYMYCLFNLLLSYLSAVCYLAFCADMRWAKRSTFKQSFSFSQKSLLVNGCFLLHLSCQVFMIRSLVLSYGWLAVTVCPGYSWWFVATIFLAVHTWNRAVVIRR